MNKISGFVREWKRQEANFKCNKCWKSFILRNSFLAHIKYYCNVERKHKCPACSRKFSRRNNLNQHLLRCKQYKLLERKISFHIN